MAHNLFETVCERGHLFQTLTGSFPRCPVCANLVPADGTFIDLYGYRRERTISTVPPETPVGQTQDTPDGSGDKIK